MKMIRKDRKMFDLMSKEKEDILKKGKNIFLLLSIIVLSCSIIHGKESMLRDEEVNENVAGNGREVNGTGSIDYPPDNNKMTILWTARVKGNVYGAINNTNNPQANVTNNEVFIELKKVFIHRDGFSCLIQGDIQGEVYGGRSDNGEAVGNTVKIKKGDILGVVYGGYGRKEARENVVHIKEGIIRQSVNGGESLGNAISNKVVISSGEICAVYGGESQSREAAKNEVEIRGGRIWQDVIGGVSSRAGKVMSNKVEISRGNIAGDVLGGKSEEGKAAENEVAIKGGTVEKNVVGGKSSGHAISNKLIITGGEIKKAVIGGWSYGTGTASSNTVTISNGDITITSNVYGGKSKGDVKSNKVEISRGNIAGDVFGGKSEEGEARGNGVQISGGTIGQSVYGGWSQNGVAEGNVVRIIGGTIEQDVFGGKGSRRVRSNKVEINSGEIKKAVIGGRSEGNTTSNKVVIGSDENIVNITSNVYGGYSVAGEATGNVVKIAGGPAFSFISTNTIIYGGYSESGKESKRGNVLKIRAKGIEVLGIKNFEAYKFYNPMEKEIPVLKVGNVVDLSGVKVSVEELNNTEGIEVGDRYVLIKSSSGIKGIDAVKIPSTQEMLARYDYETVVEDNELKVRIKLKVIVRNIEVNTKSKELTEARVGSMIFVGEGISREIGKEIQGQGEKVKKALIKYFNSLGISREIGKEIQGEKENRKVKPFVVVREGKSKYGNEIKEVGGVRVGGGIVKGIEKFGREMVLGAYVEYGDGQYRSKEEIGGEVNSRGKSNYVGIGLKGEVEIKERIYGQIGMRIGKYDSDFESEDMGVGSKEGEEMKYDIEGMYAGVEVGGRYKVVEKEKIGVEVKGEIGMMSMGGKEVKLTSGNRVDFKGVKIGKVRMEVRGEYEVKEKVKPYVGLGCEYDKMWEVEARSGNLEIPSSHIEGISGIGEMGVEAEIGKIGIRCGCECYVGERKEVDGMLKVRYAI